MGKRANVAMASGPATPGTVGNSGAETTPEKIAKIKAEPAEQATRERERGGYHIDTAMRDTQMYVHNNNNDHNNDNNTNTYIYIYMYTHATCYTYTYIYIYICIHIHVCMCIYIYIIISLSI